MRRLIQKIWVLLFVFSITACQKPATPAFLPTSTLPPPVSTGTQAAYPPANSFSTVYPYPPFSLKTDTPSPFHVSTPTPTVSKPKDTFKYPTPSPLPEYTQSIHYLHPDCTQDGSYLHCRDDILGIQFSYLSHWGQIQAELVNGTCGGFFYGYHFDGLGPGIQAGGVSLDYCKQMEGDLFTLFNGFEPGLGCDLFRNAQVCRQITDQVFVATIFPDFMSICSPGPGTFLIPLMVIGINIPKNHSVAGFIFSNPFLSAEAEEQFFAPFGGFTKTSESCPDPKTEEKFTQTLQDLIIRINNGTVDEGTAHNMNMITDLANSISFYP